MNVPARQKLEVALAEYPDDLATHAAYGDLLQEQGDPRGEFICIQLALENPSTLATTQRDQLQRRQDELVNAHGPGWLGTLAPFLFRHSDEPPDDDEADWSASYCRGWLSTLNVGVLTTPLARALVSAPETRLLKELFIHHVKWEGRSGPLVELSLSPYLGNVRVLRLDANPEGEDENAEFGADGSDVVELIQALHRIESIALRVSYLDTSTLFGLGSLRRLRSLTLDNVYHGIALDALVANPQLAQLRELRLRSWRPERGSAFPDAARALAHANCLPQLIHLELCSYGESSPAVSGSDSLCAEIARSGILRQLRVLVLRLGDLTDEGARALASSPDLPRLERVELREARLTDFGRQALRTSGARVVTTP